MDNAMMKYSGANPVNAMMGYAAPLDAGGNHRAIGIAPGTNYGGSLTMQALKPMSIAGGMAALPTGLQNFPVGAGIGAGAATVPLILGMIADGMAYYGGPEMMDRNNQAIGGLMASDQLEQQPMQYAPKMPYIPR